MKNTYKLKALSICLSGQVFKKGENEPVGGFTEKHFNQNDLEKAEKAGYLELVNVPEVEVLKEVKAPIEKKPKQKKDK